jgi:ATP-binding cassette, subfamily B, bacterial
VNLVVSMVRLHPRLFAVAVVGATLFAICTVASSFAVLWVIDNVILPRFDDGQVAVGAVLSGAGLIIGIGLVRAVSVVIRRSFAGITQWRVAETLSRDVVDRLVRQPASWHQRRADGDLVARAGVDVDASISVLAPIPFATGTVVLLFISSAWMLNVDLVMGAAAVLVFPLLLGINVVYQRRVDHHFVAAQHHLGGFSAGVHESFEGVQLVKAYGAEDRETERLAAIAADVRDARVRAVRLRSTFEAMLEVIPSMTNVGLVVLGAQRISTGDVTVGELSSIIFLFTLLVFPLRLIGYTLSELPRSMAGWQRVRSVLDEPIEADPMAAVGRTPPAVGIEMDSVSFRHAGEGVDAVHDVSLQVRRGEILAVVGATGSGKTTLVELAGGLLPVRSGQVRLAAGTRSMVFQEAFLFSGTVRENLCIGEGHDDEALWSALRLASAEEFVSALPHGLDTVVGERGVSLSGGQRQRLALARALVRRPEVLVLDDTTSALDPTTESAVLGNLRNAASDTTVLMVASRPSTIALADRVAFMASGTVVASGEHRRLLDAEPRYRELVEAFETDRAVTTDEGGDS